MTTKEQKLLTARSIFGSILCSFRSSDQLSYPRARLGYVFTRVSDRPNGGTIVIEPTFHSLKTAERLGLMAKNK